MRTKQKYDKETLNQYSWIQLFHLQSRLADRRMKPLAIINVCLSVISFFIKIQWVKWADLTITTALTIWLVVLTVRFIRINRILEDKTW